MEERRVAIEKSISAIEAVVVVEAAIAKSAVISKIVAIPDAITVADVYRRGMQGRTVGFVRNRRSARPHGRSSHYDNHPEQL